MQGCLSPEELRRFARGWGGEGEARARHHIAECKACAAALEECRTRLSEDTILSPPPGINATLSAIPGANAATAPAARTARLLPNIDGYRIQGVLGQGGMGIVYRAVQTKLNRAVALKVLPAIVGSASPSAVARFRREATAAARLHHTNIIPIYDFGESPDAYYYAMELITGQPLNEVIGRLSELNASSASPARLATMLQTVTSETPVGALDVFARGSDSTDPSSPGSMTINASSTGRGRPYFSQVARWIADAADALHYAHGQGIIHRDIKPANLILSIDGRIMIADFGLAKSAQEESVTMTGSLLGTLRYISPEQAMAKRVRVDHRTDIYSLGATLYELLTFQPAFPGTDEKEILGAIITRDPVRTRKILPIVPSELETICLKMMEKSPDARYPTARAVAEDLRRFLNDIPIVARRPGPAARMWKFVRRHKAPVVAVASAVLLLATGMFFIRERNRRMQEQIQAEESLQLEQARTLAAQVDSLLQEGGRHFGAKSWDLAGERFEKAMQLDPRCVKAHVNLAIVKKELFNSRPNAPQTLLEEATELCNRALELDPNYVNTWNLKGVLLKKVGKYSEATVAYARATELDPSSVAVWNNLGIIQALDRDLDAAEISLTRAAELAGKTPPCSVHAWRNLASIRLFRGHPSAMSDVSQAVACDDKDAWSVLVRARASLEQSKGADPREILVDAMVADRLSGEKQPKVKRILALALLRNNEFEKAAQNAQKGLDAGDLPAENHLLIALAYGKLGDVRGAKVQFDRAKVAWPESLKEKSAFEVSADEGGVLWFDSADHLFTLREEAAALVGASPELPE